MSVNAEVSGLLKHLQHTPHAEAAWHALQQYRADALAGARDGADRQAKEHLVAQARERLRSRLLHLIQNRDTARPAVQYVVRRTLLLREHADAGLDVRDRAERVRTVMIAREVRVNAMDGMSPQLAVVAAKNNLAVRLRELDDEVLTELARLQGKLWRKIDRLPEDLGDSVG